MKPVDKVNSPIPGGRKLANCLSFPSGNNLEVHVLVVALALMAICLYNGK
jgi:hypothetical protein